ncbi:MAG: hypothetical protein BWX50_00525 [Euryarchaeota archaeon ADurb.Bin009]|nr:MAG: hypothetical protein BWX50_00525 [Euryarchaeota archaeon ADurb.Bin009]
MLVVDPGYVDGVDLDEHLLCDRHLDPLQLLGEEKFRSLAPAILLPLILDPGVDLLSDRRIDGAERHRHVPDVVLRQFIDRLGEHEAVRAEAHDQVRELLVNQPERFERLGVCKRFARSRDADHLHKRIVLDDLPDQVEAFLRCENLARHARPALVHAVEVSHTVVALDVALRGDGEVAPSKGVACFVGVAGVLADLAELLRIVGDLSALDRCGPVRFIGHNL